jgi:outer membrane protein assembly factor BamB
MWNYAHDCSLLSTDSSIFFVCLGVVETIAVADGAKKWTKKFSETGDLSRDVHVGPHGGLLGYVLDRATNSKSLVALQPENGSVKWSLKVDDDPGDWDIDGWASSVDGWAHSPGSVFAAPHTPCEDWYPGGKPAKPRKLDLLFVNGTDGHIQTNRSYNVAPEWTPGSYPDPCFMVSPLVPILGSNGEVWVPFLMDEDGVCNHRAFDLAGITYRTLPCFRFEKTTRKKDDGTVEDLFVTSQQHAWNDPTSVLVYSGTTGQLLWNASIADLSFETHNLGFGPNGTIFGFDLHRDMLVAIRNGNEAWRAQGMSALMAEDGTTYISGSLNGTVVAVDLNGKQKWSWSRAMLDPTVGSVLESSIAVV